MKPSNDNNGKVIPFKNIKHSQKTLLDFLLDVADQFEDSDIIGLTMIAVHADKDRQIVISQMEFIPHGQPQH